MADIIVPYDAAVFNSVPDIDPQHDAFMSRQGGDFVQDTLGSLIAKHDLEKELGIILVHRHFPVAPNAKLVEVGNVTVPWLNDTNEFNIALEGNTNLVYPKSWMLHPESGCFMPYEFGFTPKVAPEDRRANLTEAKYALFLQAFAETVKSHGWDQLIGLCLRPHRKEPVVEFSVGQANITVDASKMLGPSTTLGVAHVETTWAFEGGRGMLMVRCESYCFRQSTGGHGSKGHQKKSSVWKQY